MVDGRKLKAKMVECGISQRELASTLGVGLNHINEVLNCKVSPRLSLVCRLCDILKITSIEEKNSIFFECNVPKTEH